MTSRIVHIWVQLQGVDKVLKHLHFLLLQNSVAEVELNDVGEDGVEVSVEPEQHNLSEVGVVDVSHHVEQKLLDSSQNLVKI